MNTDSKLNDDFAAAFSAVHNQNKYYTYIEQ